MHLEHPPKKHIALFASLLAASAALYLHFACWHEPSVDEAVFGRGSLEIVGGDWGLTGWRVMKPPIIYYVQAISRMIFGVSAFAGRIPGVLATLGCLVLLFRFSRRWFDSTTGLLAVSFMIVSPFVLFHFPNARTDAIAMFFVMLSIDQTGAKRYGWAGFAYALSFCTRQLAALSFPLVIAFAFFVDYISAKEARINPKSYVRITWRFFKGTLPALLVLFVWSLFEKIPFAWLVHELSFKKYKSGPHRELNYLEKLDYWMHGIFEFFGNNILVLFACVAVVVGCLVLVSRLRGKWNFHNNTKRAVVFLLSAFVVLFVMVHCARFFNTKYRFLVPIVPWVMLLTAWFSMEMIRKTIAWNRRFGTIAGVFFVVAFLSLAAFSQADYVKKMSEPWATDDIPVVVKWIDKNAKPGAVLFSQYGAESDYATWQTKVKKKKLNFEMKPLADYSAKYLGRDLFLYLSPKQFDQIYETLQQNVQPRFALKPVTKIEGLIGRFFSIKVADMGGIENDKIKYWQNGRMITEELNCDIIEKLFLQAVSKDENPNVTLTWKKCEPSDKPNEISWQFSDFKVGKLKVADAHFVYHNPDIDWTALCMTRRLIIKNASVATADIVLNSRDLAGFIQEKNKNLDNVVIDVQKNGLRITGVAKIFGRQLPVEVNGVLNVQGNKVFFGLHSSRAGKRNVPSFLLPYLENLMNPAFKIDLNAWFLKPVAVKTMPPPDNKLSLNATKKMIIK